MIITLVSPAEAKDLWRRVVGAAEGVGGAGWGRGSLMVLLCCEFADEKGNEIKGILNSIVVVNVRLLQLSLQVWVCAGLTHTRMRRCRKYVPAHGHFKPQKGDRATVKIDPTTHSPYAHYR